MKFNKEDKKDYANFLSSEAKSERAKLNIAKTIQEELMHNYNLSNIYNDLEDIYGK